MELGLFTMPLHRPDKPWAQMLREDREQILLAERLGFSEVWIGEHFSTRAEPIPSALVFLATLIEQTSTIRLGTGVINLPHHHPVVVAAETALFDQLSGGRLNVGVGPGGLMSDGELFGHEDMGERYAIAMESLDAILELWSGDAPIRIEGEHFDVRYERLIWKDYGVGMMPRPLQQPHPPIAMAMVGPGGPTAKMIAERDFIPISANFVGLDAVEAQWRTYAETRNAIGKPADPGVWRVCRNVLVADSDAQAEEILADPDGVFAYYFRYLRGIRRLDEVRALDDPTPQALNELLEIDQAYADCVIAGSRDTVLERLVGVVDRLGPFGTLVAVGHDEEPGLDGLWARSMQRLAEDVRPALAQHAAARRPANRKGSP